MTRIENVVTFIQEKKSLLVIGSVCIIYMGVFIYVTMTKLPCQPIYSRFPEFE